MPKVLKNSRSRIQTDPLRNFKFLVKISGTAGVPDPPGANLNNFAFGFSSVSGLNLTTEPIAYRQGGYNTTMQKMPGQSDFSPITFQRGVIMESAAAWYWMKEIFFVIQGQGYGDPGANFRRTLEIFVLDHPVTRPTTGDGEVGIVKWRAKVYNAWPVSISYSDLDAGGNQIFMEQMTLVHEGWDITWGAPSPGAEAPAPKF